MSDSFSLTTSTDTSIDFKFIIRILDHKGEWFNYHITPSYVISWRRIYDEHIEQVNDHMVKIKHDDGITLITYQTIHHIDIEELDDSE